MVLAACLSESIVPVSPMFSGLSSPLVWPLDCCGIIPLEIHMFRTLHFLGAFSFSFCGSSFFRVLTARVERVLVVLTAI